MLDGRPMLFSPPEESRFHATHGRVLKLDVGYKNVIWHAHPILVMFSHSEGWRTSNCLPKRRNTIRASKIRTKARLPDTWCLTIESSLPQHYLILSLYITTFYLFLKFEPFDCGFRLQLWINLYYRKGRSYELYYSPYIFTCHSCWERCLTNRALVHIIISLTWKWSHLSEISHERGITVVECVKALCELRVSE